MVSSGPSVQRGQVVFLRDSSFLFLSSYKGNNCSTFVVILIASVREACGFLRQTALFVLSIYSLVNTEGLVLAPCLA